MDRTKLLDKVKALLAKTLSAGCTEQEAGAALAKAQAMIDAYEISDAELALTKAERAIIRVLGSHDPHYIKRSLAFGIAEFSNTECWRNDAVGLVYCGLKADVELAEWLSGTLTSFVQRELCAFLASSTYPQGSRRLLINGFVIGCTARITARLSSLVAARQQLPSNGRALVVVQQTAIRDFLEENKITLGKARRSSRKGDFSSYAAGQSAAERATFGRPIGGAGAGLRLT